MRFTIQIVIENGDHPETIEEIIQFEKGFNTVGMTLLESKQWMKALQNKMVLHQVK